LLHLALIAPEVCEAHGGAEFPWFGLLLAGDWEVRSAVHEISCVQRRRTHEAMPNHERHGRPLLFGKRQKLRGKVAQCIAVEGISRWQLKNKLQPFSRSRKTPRRLISVAKPKNHSGA
jgi:hypothetical protein